MALFIKRRLDAGEKKNEIAAKLGYKNGYVTEHLALLEAPPCVEKAYANGATSARTLYDLRRLHDEFPEQVDAWCASGVEVTRDTVEALAQKFRRDEILVVAPEPHGPSGAHAADDLQMSPSTRADTATGPSSDTHTLSTAIRHNKQVVNRPRAGRSSTRLLIRVEHGGRGATVQEESVVLIRYDDGGTAAVPLASTVVLGAAAI